MPGLLAFLVLAQLLAPAASDAGGGTLRVWCLGDSIVRRYARELKRLESGWDIIDVGLGAERSDEGLVRLDLLLRQGATPDVVVIIYGANDLVAGMLHAQPGFGPETALENIRAMAKRLRAAGAIPIIALPVGAPPIRQQDPGEAQDTLKTLRQGFASLRRLLHRERPHVDFRLVRHELFIDPVHPSPAGGAIIARRARAAIRRALRQRAPAQKAGGGPGVSKSFPHRIPLAMRAATRRVV